MHAARQIQLFLFVLSALLLDTNLYASEKQAHDAYCQQYAQEATQQFYTNKLLGCGFDGVRWSSDLKGQRDWCSTVRRSISDTENEFRSLRLSQCHAKKRVEIPEACNDSSSRYLTVKAFRNYRSLISPVKNGLIRYDYNQDEQDDYVFFEIGNNDAKVTMCFSGKSGYKRQTTDLKLIISEAKVFEAEGINLQQVGDLLKVKIRKHDHNVGSSKYEFSYRYQPSSKTFKVINSEELYHAVQPGYYFSPPEAPVLFTSGK